MLSPADGVASRIEPETSHEPHAAANRRVIWVSLTLFRDVECQNNIKPIHIHIHTYIYIYIECLKVSDDGQNDMR